MKVTALNPCRRHVWSRLGIVMIALTAITSCKKDEEITPANNTIGTETLRHHRHWNDTIKNSPGAIGIGGNPTTTGGTTTAGSGTSTSTTGAGNSGTTTPTGGSTSTAPKTSGTTTTTGSGTPASSTTGATTSGATATTGGSTTTVPKTSGTTTTTGSGTSTGTPVAAKPTSGTTTSGATTTTKPASGTTTTASGSTTATKPASGTTTTTPPSTTKPTTTPTTAAPTYKASAAITLNGKSNVTISGLAVPSITLNNCTNIRIVNCKIGPSTIDGVLIYNSTGVTVDSCLLSNVRTGVNAVQSKGIVFSNSQAKNMQGPYPHGQFVQYNNVTGGGNKVINNKFENVLGQSDPEDAISMYQSSGLSNDPIVISGNSIRGGGPSHTGGGIMLGDGGGSNIIAENNTLVDPGQYGMAISGGTNMSIINNNIYGKQQSFTNVGLYYWNQSGKASSNITISGNKINFTSSSGQQNNTWLPSGTVTPSGWSTNVMSSSLTESLLPAVLTSL